tara:strand:+ start:167 stop:577 length:411 start_codon:yes stop_codon:yes gene_type:complete
MGYFIELAFDILKANNFLDTKKIIMKLADKHGVEFSYNNHEIMGKNRTIYRNHYVMSFQFNENEEEVAAFISGVKKLRNVNIESVGYDNCIFKLMYASKKYLNIMDKYKAREYLEQKKNNTIYKNDSVILKQCYKK